MFLKLARLEKLEDVFQVRVTRTTNYSRLSVRHQEGLISVVSELSWQGNLGRPPAGGCRIRTRVNSRCWVPAQSWVQGGRPVHAMQQ